MKLQLISVHIIEADRRGFARALEGIKGKKTKVI